MLQRSIVKLTVQLLPLTIAGNTVFRNILILTFVIHKLLCMTKHERQKTRWGGVGEEGVEVLGGGAGGVEKGEKGWGRGEG